MASSSAESMVLVAAPDGFTEANWQMLMAIMDTVIPSIQKESVSAKGLNDRTVSDREYDGAIAQIKEEVVGVSDDQLLEVYFNEKASSIPQFQELLRETVSKHVREDAKKGLAFVMSALK